MTAAIGEHASWGYFDYRMKGESSRTAIKASRELAIGSPRKRAFFALLAQVTGSEPGQ